MAKFTVQLTRTDFEGDAPNAKIDDTKEYVVEAKNLTDAGEVAAAESLKDGFRKSASEGWRAVTQTRETS